MARATANGRTGWSTAVRQRRKTVLVRNEESDMRNACLKEALSRLTERERRVIEARKLQDDPATLDDLSTGVRRVSRERIRQIEVRAFEKLQKAVKNAAQKALAPKTQALPAPV
jgi:RNA polymerase sigma-32 factor